jgi:hypothetical protein
MLSYELRPDKYSDGGFSSHALANAASRGRGTPWRNGNNSSHGRGHFRGSGCGASPGGSCGGFNNSSPYRRGPAPSSAVTSGSSWPKCQVCLKVGHNANVSWYRYDEEYVPHNRVATMASTSTRNNPNCYLDSGATNHITSKLEKLTMHERYNGADQIRVANGACMNIAHVGKSVIPSPSCPLHLNRALHVPHAHKHLISIHRSILIVALSLSYICIFPW